MDNDYTHWDDKGYFHALNWYKVELKECFFYFYVDFEENNFVISYFKLDEKPIEISNVLVKAKNVKDIADLVLGNNFLSFDSIKDKQTLDFLNFRKATDLCKT
jgi:hypothetical protein